MPKLTRVYAFFTALVSVLFCNVANAQTEHNLFEVSKSLAPSVVNISAFEVDAQARQALGVPSSTQALSQLYRNFLSTSNPVSAKYKRKPTPLGSGVVISADGYILTNEHVIHGSNRFVVRFSNQQEFDAKLMGIDVGSDIALLKIDTQNLVAIQPVAAQSEALGVGQSLGVLAAPTVEQLSFATTLISTGSNLEANESYTPLWQTTLPFMAGSSGAPLFNTEGKVVALNSQIMLDENTGHAFSFAIPIHTALDVAQQLEQTGQVQRAWLGVIIQEIDQHLSQSFGLDGAYGALIGKVLPDSPAAKAGLQEGDVVVAFNHHLIGPAADLPAYVSRMKPGQDVSIKLVRNGTEHTLDVELGLLPQSANAYQVEPQDRRFDDVGIRVSPLTDAIKAKWNLSAGVVITDVTMGVASQAGLMPGDVITMLNGNQIENMAEFAEVVANLPNTASVPMRIVRRGSPRFIPLQLHRK